MQLVQNLSAHARGWGAPVRESREKLGKTRENVGKARENQGETKGGWIESGHRKHQTPETMHGTHGMEG